MFYCCNENTREVPVEEWKEIEEFNGRYLVSNYGRIKSLIGKPKILKQYKTTGNYLFVKLSKNHKARRGKKVRTVKKHKQILTLKHFFYLLRFKGCKKTQFEFFYSPLFNSRCILQNSDMRQR